jgi:hypothetical protein
MKEFEFAIDINPDNNLPAIPRINATFGRINVLLGANGTGKSRALNFIRFIPETFQCPGPAVYIEGGRVIPIPRMIGYNNDTFNQFGTLERAKATFVSRRLQSLSQRISDPFYLLDRKEADAKILHSEEVTKWQANGQQGSCPLLGESPLA